MIVLIVCLFCCDARYIPEDGIYTVPDKMPIFPIGYQGFDSLLLQGVVSTVNTDENKLYVSFVVNMQGEMESIKVVKGLYPEIDSMVMTNFQKIENNWIPGESSGEPVRVRMVYVIDFERKNLVLN